MREVYWRYIFTICHFLTLLWVYFLPLLCIMYLFIYYLHIIVKSYSRRQEYNHNHEDCRLEETLKILSKYSETFYIWICTRNTQIHKGLWYVKYCNLISYTLKINLHIAFIFFVTKNRCVIGICRGQFTYIEPLLRLNL